MRTHGSVLLSMAHDTREMRAPRAILTATPKLIILKILRKQVLDSFAQLLLIGRDNE
jgi:hypothetical protein